MNDKCAKGIHNWKNRKGVKVMEIPSHTNLSQYDTIEIASY